MHFPKKNHPNNYSLQAYPFAYFLKREPRTPLTPLRYPGGKRKLAPLIHNLISVGRRNIELFVEPFIGGGSIAISFLEAYPNTRIAIADADPLVAAFWAVTFSSNARNLADKIADTKPSIKLWQQVKESCPKKQLDLAYKCLFLNRTNFSGIIHDHAGPIGGLEQTSAYTIDCRFNAESLANRILQLSNYCDRVHFIRCQSWRKTIRDVSRLSLVRLNPKQVFWYLDPPFFQKANRLYRFTFTPKDHRQLKAYLDQLPGSFVLSYDDVPEARDLYADHGGFARVELAYNARIDRGERLGASEIVVSNIINDLRTSQYKIDATISLPRIGWIKNQANRSISLD